MGDVRSKLDRPVPGLYYGACSGRVQARMSTVDGHPYKVEVGGSNPSVPTTDQKISNAQFEIDWQSG